MTPAGRTSMSPPDQRGQCPRTGCCPTWRSSGGSSAGDGRGGHPISSTSTSGCPRRPRCERAETSRWCTPTTRGDRSSGGTWAPTIRAPARVSVPSAASATKRTTSSPPATTRCLNWPRWGFPWRRRPWCRAASSRRGCGRTAGPPRTANAPAWYPSAGSSGARAWTRSSALWPTCRTPNSSSPVDRPRRSGRRSRGPAAPPDRGIGRGHGSVSSAGRAAAR